MDLQHDFTKTSLPLTPDSEGKNIATLISSKYNNDNRDAVLYIHGFIDYFFHPHVAEQFHQHDMDFYALDLRKYGRSLLPHQTPNYCEDMREYFEEITLAITEIQKNMQKKLFILAHSTGCLAAGLYLNDGKKKDAISGLILNSPFLDIPQSRAATTALYNMAKVLTRIKPKAQVGRAVNRVYPKSIHKNFSGEWDFSLTWKPLEGFPTYFKWAIAVVNAQRELQTRSKIRVPVLSMHSDKSSRPKRVTKKARHSDTVLWVKHMKKFSPKLGRDVTLLKVKNGKHDLFLSKKTVRQKAFKDMFKWLNNIR